LAPNGKQKTKEQFINQTVMKRRNFLTTSLIGLLGTSKLNVIASERKANKRSLRFVHLTDMHIHSGPVPESGIKHLLDDIHSLEDKPDFAINTGDNIMDSLKRSKEDTADQWNSWRNYYRSKLNYELYSCIGNHDTWGWGLKNKELENDPLFGKAWAIKELELSHRYYSMDKNGWHFIFLDSTFRDPNSHSYIAKLDKEQFNWLKDDLSQTGTLKPICIVSHIPIISTSVFFDGNNEKSGNWNVPGSWMHIDARKIKDLFADYPNIKLAISGHVHLADKTNYLGIDYLCNGAASGGWWFGKYQEFSPMYAIIDLYEDGTFNSQLVQYNWKQRNINIDPVVKTESHPQNTSSL
jgi:3',5'-cyclic AMP phosphodiesterase CpdA